MTSLVRVICIHYHSRNRSLGIIIENRRIDYQRLSWLIRRRRNAANGRKRRRSILHLLAHPRPDFLPAGGGDRNKQNFKKASGPQRVSFSPSVEKTP